MSTMFKPAVVALGVLFLAACSPADDRAADTALGGTDTTIIPSLPAIAPDTTAPAGRTVHVVLKEWSVAPSETTLAPGQVTFHVMNEGQYDHALEVEREGSEQETATIRPGGTATLSMNLTPGTYTLYCPIADTHGNHQQRGMRATVTVQ